MGTPPQNAMAETLARQVPQPRGTFACQPLRSSTGRIILGTALQGRNPEMRFSARSRVGMLVQAPRETALSERLRG